MAQLLESHMFWENVSKICKKARKFLEFIPKESKCPQNIHALDKMFSIHAFSIRAYIYYIYMLILITELYSNNLPYISNNKISVYMYVYRIV